MMKFVGERRPATGERAGRAKVERIGGLPDRIQLRFGQRRHAPPAFASPRGYNLSSKPEGVEAYQLGVTAADIFALASAFGRDRFHLVGHDWGAAVAWTMAGLNPKRLTSATMIQAPHPAVWLRAMREDPKQRQKSRYVQILRMPWLSEMSLKLGNFAGLARAFRSSTRPDAFSPETLDIYREA